MLSVWASWGLVPLEMTTRSRRHRDGRIRHGHVHDSGDSWKEDGLGKGHGLVRCWERELLAIAMAMALHRQESVDTGWRGQTPCLPNDQPLRTLNTRIASATA